MITPKRTVMAAACIILYGSAGHVHSQRTTWLMVDFTARMNTPTCDNNDCINGHNSSSKIQLNKLLPGTPRKYRGGTGPDYVKDGYWHIVINCIKTDGPSDGPGSTGSLRVCPAGINDNAGAYYLFMGKGDCQKCTKNWVEGKATHYRRKFSDWRDYNKFNFKDEYWDRDISKWTFGPVKSRAEAEAGANAGYTCFYDINPKNTCMTPLTYRARVWITLDPNFVPPYDPSDPVGVQPGTTGVAFATSGGRDRLQARPVLRLQTVRSPSKTPEPSTYSIFGRRITRPSETMEARIVVIDKGER